MPYGRPKSDGDRLAYFPDKVGRWHAALQPPAPEAACRFENLRGRLMNVQLAGLGSAALPMLALVLCDLILRMEDLSQAWDRLDRPLSWKGRVFVSWVGTDGRWRRRYLSARTALAAAALREKPPFDLAVAAADDALRSALPSFRGGYSFEELLKDGAVWANANVSPYLALSVTGVCPLACLPDSALARESAQSRLAPSEEPREADEAAGPLARPESEQTELWGAIDAALTCEEGTDLSRRRAIVDRLNGVLSRSESMTEGECLVVSWCVELIETGTPTTSPIRAATGADYIRRIGPGLLREVDAALSALDEPVCWVRMYSALIEQADEGSRHKAHAALTAFHAFAVAHVEAPRLRSITSIDVNVEPPPRANRLWAHEVDWIRRQTNVPTDGSGDARFRRQLRVLFELLRESGARSSDIVSLRIDDVRFFDAVMILSIDPWPGDGSLKSVRSRRQVRVDNAEVVSLARQWVALRQSESATASALLFGQPDGTRRVWQHVASLVGVGRLIKEATGESLLGPHVLRHTRVTEFAESVECTPEGQRQFHAFAARLGHGVDVTTHRDYNHSSDWVLLRQLQELDVDVQMSWAAAAQWLGASEVALRKRASRSGLNRVGFLSAAMSEALCSLQVPDVQTRFRFVERTAPKWPSRSYGLGFKEVLAICRDAAAGNKPIGTLAARNLTEPRLVRAILQRLAAEAGVPGSLDESEGRLVSRVSEAIDRLHGSVDFGRLDQPKMIPVVQFALRDSSRTNLLGASIAWERIRRGRHLSLERPGYAHELLVFLRDAGVAADQVVAAIETRDGTGESGPKDLRQIVLARVSDVFGRAPSLMYVRPRGGRPRAYLAFKDRTQPGASPAAVSVAGLQALMLAASIWRRLLDQVS